MFKLLAGVLNFAIVSGPCGRLMAAMSEVPADLKYTKDHEWARIEPDGSVTIGITDHAQASLGDITFVELPAVGEHFDSGATFGVVESVKAASDLYMPVAGSVVSINDQVTDAPESLNQSPYSDAWLLRIQPDNPEDLAALLSPDTYSEMVD